jgi:glycosyltransferase involved in cell wall biosynthesis
VDTPLVSVVMPVYNASAFLHEAIQSILAQTFTNFEFIIINDGSTDSSTEIILSYPDPRIKYISNAQNQGLVASLNVAINTAKGFYIARMDADDIAYPDRLEVQIGYLQRYPNVKLLGSQVRLIDSNAKPFGFWKHPVTPAGVKEDIKRNCCFAHPSVVFEKQVFDELSGYSMNYKVAAEDYDLWMRILERHQGANTEQVLVDYRIHTSNFSSTNLLKQALSCLAVQHHIPAKSNVQLSTLVNAGVPQHDVAMQVVNCYLFWIETYRQIPDYAICQKLSDDFKAISFQLNSSRANAVFTRYQIGFNFKLFKFGYAMVCAYQYIKQRLAIR